MFQDDDESFAGIFARGSPSGCPEPLDPREERVIRMRYGIGMHSQTLEEVAQHFSVTRERVRQIEVRALQKLRKCKSGGDLAKAMRG